MGLFLRARRKGVGNVPLEPLLLTSNFRSQAGVVAWVNKAFRRAFPAREEIERGAVAYSEARPVREELAGPAVTVHSRNGRDDAAEAEEVVALVRQVIVRVGGRDGGRPGPLPKPSGRDPSRAAAGRIAVPVTGHRPPGAAARRPGPDRADPGIAPSRRPTGLVDRPAGALVRSSTHRPACALRGPLRVHRFRIARGLGPHGISFRGRQREGPAGYGGHDSRTAATGEAQPSTAGGGLLARPRWTGLCRRAGRRRCRAGLRPPGNPRSAEAICPPSNDWRRAWPGFLPLPMRRPTAVSRS